MSARTCPVDTDSSSRSEFARQPRAMVGTTQQRRPLTRLDSSSALNAQDASHMAQPTCTVVVRDSACAVLKPRCGPLLLSLPLLYPQARAQNSRARLLRLHSCRHALTRLRLPVYLCSPRALSLLRSALPLRSRPPLWALSSVRGPQHQTKRRARPQQPGFLERWSTAAWSTSSCSHRSRRGGESS